MAATNPLRVSDLIAKYGWKIMPYLSNLGVRSLAEAQILFVDSGAASTLDADDGVHGHSLTEPLATIDYAIGLLTASEAGIVIVAPGHAETKAATGALNTVDVNGVTVIGLGEGLLRPTLTLSTDTGAVGFLVSAANVTLINMRILVSIDALVSAISVTGTDCKLIDMEVQDNANTTEAAVAILTAATADRLHVERFRHNGFVDGDACTESLSLIGVDRAVIKDCWFRGVFSIATINMLTTACTGIIVENCKFENGTEALVSDIVDNQASSVWSAINCWDVVGGYAFNGGSGKALTPVRLNAAEIVKNPNSAFAEVYWVDADSGSDSNDGLDPARAFATVEAAITANNTAFDADSDPMRTMYIHSKTYTENLTAFPKNCTVIGIGGKVRIMGYHSFSHAQNCRIHNIQFKSNQASTPIVSATGNCHGLEFHECVFDSSGTISECLKFAGNSSDMVVENCRIGYQTNAANAPDIAIRFAGTAAQRGKVINNQIYCKPVTGIGIQIDSTMSSGNFLLIKDNVIMGNPASDDQCAVGIKDLTASPRGGVYVANYISAVDGMFFTVAGIKSAWLSMGNLVNENGSSLREDSLV